MDLGVLWLCCAAGVRHSGTYQSNPRARVCRPPQTPRPPSASGAPLLSPGGQTSRLDIPDTHLSDMNLSAAHSLQLSISATMVCTSRMMKNSSPGSPCTTIFWRSTNGTISKASATVRRSHLSRDSVQEHRGQRSASPFSYIRRRQSHVLT